MRKLFKFVVAVASIVVATYLFVHVENENNEVDAETIYQETTMFCTESSSIDEESCSETVIYQEEETYTDETTAQEDAIQTYEEITATEEDVFLEEDVDISTEEETTSNLIYLGTYKLTAYCPCYECNGQWTGQPTASGTDYVAGRTVACNSIPLGTHILINGHEYIVEDTGGMSNNIVDIFFNTHAETNVFGVQYADVYIIK